MPDNSKETDARIKINKLLEAAEMLGVNPETLRRWDRDGTFKAVRIGKRGQRQGTPFLFA